MAGTVKIKLTDSSTREANVDIATTTVRELIEMAFPEEIGEGKEVRIIANGKKLEEDQTLDKYNIEDGGCVHAVVSMIWHKPSPEKSPEPKPAEESYTDVTYPYEDSFPAMDNSFDDIDMQ